MLFDEDLTMNELLDSMEREEMRRREMLRLPFECHFGDRQVPNQFQRSQSSQLRVNVNLNRASQSNLFGPTSSHPSDPTFQMDDEQIGLNRSIELDGFALNERKRHAIPKKLPRENYRDGIPADFHLPLRSDRIGSTYRKHSNKQTLPEENESTADVCKRLRRMRHNCEEAEQRAIKRREELDNFKSRSKEGDGHWWKDRRMDFEPMDLNDFALNVDKMLARHENRAKSGGLQLDFNGKNADPKRYVQSTNAFQSKSGDFHPKTKSSQSSLNKTVTLRRRSDSFPSIPQHTDASANKSLERLEAAGRRFPQLDKALGPILHMRGGDKNLVFEFMEMLDRRVRICEDQLKRMLRDRCSVPKTRRQLANYEICTQQRDITLLQELAALLRSTLKIAPTDDYIQRQLAANKRAPQRKQQLSILETSIGQIYL
ncbi:hypothetical protein M3Y97_00993400 [Aphelenchoides bicaudatus]|nr:hypothetical protein M3Y97_00993400 [Aphelenchoides bicaudatus]